jgi:F0F1-type ATP synthase delta subunit
MAKPVLPATIYSPARLDAAIAELDDYSLALHAQHHDFDASTLLQSVLDANRAKGDKKAVDNLIAQLKTLQPKLPVVHLTLPSRPSFAQQQRLAGWFRSEVGPDVLVSFHVDITLLAGLTVRTPNYLHDLSIGTKFAGIEPISERLKHA